MSLRSSASSARTESFVVSAISRRVMPRCSRSRFIRSPKSRWASRRSAMLGPAARCVKRSGDVIHVRGDRIGRAFRKKTNRRDAGRTGPRHP